MSDGTFGWLRLSQSLIASANFFMLFHKGVFNGNKLADWWVNQLGFTSEQLQKLESSHTLAILFFKKKKRKLFSIFTTTARITKTRMINNVSRWKKNWYNYKVSQKKKKKHKKHAQPSQENWPISKKVWIVLQKVGYVQGIWGWKGCTFMPAAQAIFHTRSTVIAIHENILNALIRHHNLELTFNFIGFILFIVIKINTCAHFQEFSWSQRIAVSYLTNSSTNRLFPALPPISRYG